MAFLSRVSNILKQSARQQSSELFASRPSIYQAIRCMSSKLFIGGISYNTDETSLREAFSKYGEVVEARVIMDRETGRSRGFGFVTFTSSEEASSAIQALDGQDLHGRQVKVNYATERTSRGPPAGNYGGGGGGYVRRENYNSNYGGGGGYGGSSGGYGGSNGGYGGSSGGYGGNSGGYGGNSGGYGGNSGGYGGSSEGYKSGDFSVAGGGGNNSFADSGVDGNSGFGFGGSGNQFGIDQSSSSIAGDAGELNQEVPLEGNYKDDGDNEHFDDDYTKRA